MTAAIVDTGPLVAFLDRSERFHAWTSERFEELEAPLLVCEAVLAEAMHLLRRYPSAQDALMGLLDTGALEIDFQVSQHIAPVRALLAKYGDRPMSLADACIVRMAEINDRHAVLTLDSDFLVYRKNGRAPQALIHPTAQ
ncbi:MAG TPA: PIN domain-containing protein [Caulobacteraceae bacterium]|nr:PIN domain-containing protein [Caulobacteraceae bacterium]